MIFDNGDIIIHGRDELSLRVIFEGEVTTGRVIYFEIKTPKELIRRLVPDFPAFPNSRLIELHDTDLVKIPANGAPYVLRDETEGIAFTRLDGFIRWRGWVK